ncbi:prolyl oligopeptidase family serine peptidase [Priestia filamentosa]|uniref:alpha/beta hydrolase family protein n=1 Tax=Priestia filamentosa TaxID=1402861 RepID=UPI002E1AE078|nr:prolyl oligopeptidase family serine peptidase [Priestia filamentosa]MED3726839.1 prolyl oligopeptidase family serine peptidase [Priestia filamentosa]
MKKAILLLVGVVICSFLLFVGTRGEGSNDIQRKIHVSSSYQNSVDTYELTYPSDELKIKGYLLKPKGTEGNWPILVYNRGGHGHYSQINEERLAYLASWANRGYVVIASQYRGNGGSEGTETYGGQDIHDVINLLNYAESLPYTDESHKVALGYSRGGMMTYLLMKNNIKFDAVVVKSGITDMFQFYDQRGPKMKEVLNQIVGPPQESKDAYRSRSVVYWPDKVNSPLLLLHGTNDKLVHYTQAEKLVKKLQDKSKEVKLVIYPNGDHPLSQYERETDAEIQNWFQAHLKK